MWPWWSAVKLLMERHFFSNPISTLKAPLETLRDSRLLEECWASMCLSCVSTFTDLSPLHRHSAPGWLFSLWVLLTEREACSLPVVQGEVKIRGGNVQHSFILLKDCRLLSAPLRYLGKRDRHTERMLIQTLTSTSHVSDRHRFSKSFKRKKKPY